MGSSLVPSPKAILIAGPTASGKSALALALAARVGGALINADSMQVYGDFRVLTARPTAADEARIPHRLYGHVDAAENYSVGRWLADAARALAEVEGAGRRPIFVGGTGLYFRALTRGLSSMPPVPEAVRATVRAEAEGIAPPALHARLAARDAKTAAALRPSDRQRIIRALEIFAATGRPLVEWQGAPGKPLIAPDAAAAVFLTVDRDELRRRIEARFEAMLAGGALDEARAFAARGLSPTLPATKAHGLPWLLKHLGGEISLAEAAAEAKADTRRYARRQETWFRNQLPEFKWMGAEEAGAWLAGAVK
jgi:tRNA dimethylallyltransferase